MLCKNNKQRGWNIITHEIELLSMQSVFLRPGNEMKYNVHDNAFLLMRFRAYLKRMICHTGNAENLMNHVMFFLLQCKIE